MNERVGSLLQEIEAFGKANDARAADRSQKMLNITPETGEFLSILVRHQPAKRVLEIGTSNGYSTLWLADAVSSTDGTIETVEMNPEKARLARINFERAGLSRFIHLVEADAAEVLAAAADSIYDFVFLDSERTEYLSWWPHILRVLRPGGLVVCDNAISHKHELEEFTAAVRRTPSSSMCLVPVGKGQLLILKHGEPA
ncbi:MAG: type 11 methyltransferase [candidate division NC10 bacterium CSP1-5]|nr:MAG: type 11 methyltransferase [candidate division NC10 bacterium CSP1-5]